MNKLIFQTDEHSSPTYIAVAAIIVMIALFLSAFVSITSGLG